MKGDEGVFSTSEGGDPVKIQNMEIERRRDEDSVRTN